MLIFIGLGLQKDGISLTGLREAQEANVVYAELYTSIIPNFDIKGLEQKIGKKRRPKHCHHKRQPGKKKDELELC